MQELSQVEAVRASSWLRAADGGGDAMVGFDPSGWEDSVWILHAMYENRELPSDVTYDQAHKARRDKWEMMVGDHDLNEVGTVTGGVLGYVGHPGKGWTRVSWDEYTSREDREVGKGQKYPPSSSWFPIRSWPVSVMPPNEGSLDDESLRALARVLSGTDGGLCLFMPSSLSTYRFDDTVINEGTFVEYIELLESGSVAFSPANIWPRDRSWFVYTDYDLWATRVSGPSDLIATIENDPDLETLRWSTPS